MEEQRPFTGMTLDRASEERKDERWLDQRVRSANAVTVVAGADGVLVSHDQDGRPSLLRIEPRDDLSPAQRPEPPILLGLDEGRPVFALDIDTVEDRCRSDLLGRGELLPLRDAASVLAHSEAGLAAYTTALLNWHRTHGFCANCGAPADVTEAGYARHCPRCGLTQFPRTDPVVIMTVEHDDHLLLGRRPTWPRGRYSVLAGFVSPGESAEEAVVREVVEESGIVAYDPEFVASQPWPFPASLMLGFAARSDGGEPRVGDGELEDVAWFSRQAVRDALAGQQGSFELPPKVAIARYLIERWAT